MNPEENDFDPTDFDLCGCGCTRDQHDAAGKCRYCFECEGWTYDEESTMLSHLEDLPCPN